MAYKHGAYGEITKSKAVAAAQADTVLVYVGCAPVNLISGYSDAGVINTPVRLRNMNEVQQLVGYSDDWGKFSLCEAFKQHFDNTVGNSGPIYVINVLDPATHKGEEVTLAAQDFSKGYVYIESDTVILDTVRVSEKVLGTDYSVSYDMAAGRVVIKALTELGANETVVYTPVDPSKIDKSTIIGAAGADGTVTGMQAIKLLYTKFNAVPNLLAAPGWSQIPEVYVAMCSAVQKINGHWEAFAIADIPVKDGESAVDTIDKAKAWQTAKGYVSERSKVCWPMTIDGTGKISHLSTVCAATMLRVDLSHESVPMESPSNKEIMATAQYFGEGSKNAGYDQTEVNGLNEVGITSACFWDGKWVLWGPHTAAYKYGTTMDARVIFDVNMRMLMFVTNGFQRRHGTQIDAPMTLAMQGEIINAEQEELDRLVGLGAIIGTPTVEFLENANSETDMMNGDFVFDISFTNTPPFKSGTARVCYTSDGFAAYFGGDA
ncbi:MAG: phage tail sheath family protein [Oscillospiraceae bacterium]|nr:phage tail sheath family protein [Oscillospiraceae bacterium]